MMETNWVYLRNAFDNSTKNNYKRMMMLARDHNDKLKYAAATDSYIMNLFNEFEPSFISFNEALRRVHTTERFRQAFTMDLEAAFKKLSSSLIENWDVRILIKYSSDTSDYRRLMGNRRAPFQTGSYESKLQAVAELSDMLNFYPALADLKSDIDEWLKITQSLRTKQQGIEGELQKSQKDVELARQELATKMHRVFAGLLYKYYENPVKVESFYELKYLQRGSSAEAEPSPQKSTTVTVEPNQNKTLMTGDFTDESGFELENKSNFSVEFWLSGDEKSNVPNDVLIVNPNTKLSVYGDEIKDGSLQLKYLIVANNNAVSAKVAFKEIPDLNVKPKNS